MIAKVSEIVEYLSTQHGQNSAKDLILMNIENLYARVRALPFVWNYKRSMRKVYKVFTPTETYTITDGSSVISSTVPTTVTQAMTGRYVVLNEEKYRVKIVGFPTANDVTLDRVFVGTTITDQSISLYRDNYTWNTPGIDFIRYNGVMVQRFSSSELFKSGRNTYDVRDYVSFYDMNGYEIDDENRIDPPLYPPVISALAVGPGPAAGTYDFFFVYRDYESGELSKPGPVLTSTLAGGNSLTFNYSSPTNKGETTYEMILCASKAKGLYLRVPFFAVGVKSPLVALSTVSHVYPDANLGYMERYYEGPQTTIKFLWKIEEDSTVESRYVSGWHGKPQDTDSLEMGDNQEIYELLSLHLVRMQQFINRDAEKSIAVANAFDYRLRKVLADDSDSKFIDPSVNEMKPISPYIEDSILFVIDRG